MHLAMQIMSGQDRYAPRRCVCIIAYLDETTDLPAQTKNVKSSAPIATDSLYLPSTNIETA